MTATITTEEQLEELRGNPEKFMDYIGNIIAEKMGDVATNSVQKEVERQLTLAKLPGRINMAGTDHNPNAQGAELDGKFKSFGEFLQCTTPTYQLKNGIDARLKNLNESDGGAGGDLVPEEFRATLMKLAIEDFIIRPRAFTLPMGSSTMKIPAIRDTSHATNIYGGVQAYWGSEAQALTSSQPTFRQIELTAKKLTGYTATSNELIQDQNVGGLEALLMRLFGDAIGFFEDDAFFNGTGAGQPLGILNSPALVSVSKEVGQAAATIVSENLDKMYSRMLPSSLNRAVWVCSHDCLPQLFALSRTVGVGGAPVFITNITQGPTMSIYGRPVIVTEQAQTCGTLGDIYFADFSYYLLGDRQALTTAVSEHVNFTTDEMAWRFVERLDGQPWLDSALTPRHGSNTLSPFVALATRA